MDSLGPHTLVPLTAEITEDEYGNDERDWDNPDRGDPIEGCSVQPAGADEYVIDREAVVVRYRAYMPGLQAIESTQRVEWQGVQYVIDGVEPWAFAQLPHTDLLLRRVEN